MDHQVAFGEHLLTAHDPVGTDPDAEPRREVGTDERDDLRGDTVDDPGAHDTPSNTRAPELAEVRRRPRDRGVGALRGPCSIGPVATEGVRPQVDLFGAVGRELERIGGSKHVVGDHRGAGRVGAHGFVQLRGSKVLFGGQRVRELHVAVRCGNREREVHARVPVCRGDRDADGPEPATVDPCGPPERLGTLRSAQRDIECASARRRSGDADRTQAVRRGGAQDLDASLYQSRSRGSEVNADDPGPTRVGHGHGIVDVESRHRGGGHGVGARRERRRQRRRRYPTRIVPSTSAVPAASASTRRGRRTRSTSERVRRRRQWHTPAVMTTPNANSLARMRRP